LGGEAMLINIFNVQRSFLIAGNCLRTLLAANLVAAGVWLSAAYAVVPPDAEVHDSHFHLTNYIQEGTSIKDFLQLMGDRVGRVALFGIPLQQTWDYENSGEFAPTYYLQTDAPLYYYSFTDAYIAQAYLSLSPDERSRFDPMITGFNPADMYGADHIRRVLQTFPGVFTGIGEFTIHKEFVSSKVAGDVASLTDPALDRILDFAADSGLLVILHSDIDIPFASEGAEPVYLTQMKDLLRRHPDTTIIWAHTGLGRVVHPLQSDKVQSALERSPEHLDILAALLEDPELQHVYFDISWTEVAKYVVATPKSIAFTAELLNRYPDRFLFGTDEVAPNNQQSYLRIYDIYAPLWSALTPEASIKVRKQNYERLFDAARLKVRAWERANRL
jgi:Amidohydrolase